VRSELIALVTAGSLKEGEIDSYELKSLASFPSSSGVEILRLFSTGNLKSVRNKSGKHALTILNYFIKLRIHIL
jgi:hypothetical protein